MQIGTKQFYQSQITSMADLQSKIGRIQEEVSAGKKLLAPSDDPGAYTVADRLNQSIANMDQYNRNIGMAKSRLSQEDSVLSSVSTIVIRLNELGIQGANSTNDSTARNAIAKEMEELSQQLVALGNSVDANGDYLFAGYKGNKPPFAASVEGVSYHGDTVGETTLKDLQNAVDHFSTYQAICGSRLQKVETADTTRLAQLTNAKTTLSTIQDSDLTALASELQQKSLTLQAAQSVFAKISQLSLFNFIK